MAHINYPEDDVVVIPDQTIPEFYTGQNVLVTGGTGLLGKILIEKLLRSCPNIGTIYMLIRPKEGVNPKDRIKQFDNHVVFERLRKENPGVLSKLRVVQGDVGEKDLAISTEDQRLLQEQINVVFHLAASVRFDDPLEKALFVNSRGTLETINLALGMKNLKAFVHTSAACCNADRFLVEEKLYPAHGDWQAFLHVAETLDPLILNVLTKKMLGRLPNAHLFSKSLAEHIVNDFKDRLPVVIVRPSVVLATLREPFVGYTDKLNGPNGMLAAGAKGLLRVVLAEKTVAPDYTMPDVVVKGMIIAAWKLPHQQFQDMQIYNASAYDSITDMSIRDLDFVGGSIIRQAAPRGIYTQNVTITKCRFLYFLLFYLLQLFPSMVLHAVLHLVNKNSCFVRIQRQIYRAMLDLNPFMMNQWRFPNHNFLDLESQLLPSDTEEFRYYYNEIDIHKYYVACAQQARIHIFKETTTLEENKKLQVKLAMLHFVICYSVAIALIFVGYVYSIPSMLSTMFLNAVKTLLVV